jgi:nitroreductase
MDELIKKTRSYRRFDEHRRIADDDLRQLIDLARLGGSARNQQPWQYMLVTDAELCALVFPHIGWAGYLSDWKGPDQGERPSAYILCLLNRDWLKGSEKEAQFDLGIATQNLLLGAMEKGIGGCRIGSISPRLADCFEIPANHELSMVIALGYPAEKVMITDLPAVDDIKYWRDESDVHFVPKRALEDIIIPLRTK